MHWVLLVTLAKLWVQGTPKIWNIPYDTCMQSSYSALVWKHRHQTQKTHGNALSQSFLISFPRSFPSSTTLWSTSDSTGWQRLATFWVTRTISKPNRTTWWWLYTPWLDIHLKHMENLRYVIQSQICCQLEYRSKAYQMATAINLLQKYGQWSLHSKYI